MQIFFLILLFIFGAIFGSFLCCQARRLHARQNQNQTQTQAKTPKSAPSKKHPSPKSSTKGNSLPSRSVCLHCGYQLKWYDNLPIVSWLVLRGKCRQCHQKIGLAEPLSELGLALTWLALGCQFLSATHTPLAFSPDFISAPILDWLIFLITLVFTLPLCFLAIYDGLYGELPTAVIAISIIISAVLFALKTISLLQFQAFCANMILDPLFAVSILSGIYLFLYLISHGQWVGDGDWLLALPLALVLGHPWPALIALFIANALATIVSLPLLRTHKSHKIPFGPFLVVAFIVTMVVL